MSTFSRRVAIAILLRSAAVGWLLFAANCALAVPAIYEATVFTDVHLNGRLYPKVDLRLTFLGDTDDIELARDANGNVVSQNTFWIAKGHASFSFHSSGRTISGKFPDGEIFIALDTEWGGVGFGTHGTNVFEPTYPLAFDSGSIYRFAVGSADLTTPVTVGGHAWSCVNFLSGACSPPIPLKTTEMGDLVVEQLFTQLDPSHPGKFTGSYSGSLNRGTFSISLGTRDN